jgi:hypothetical protein
MLLASVRRPTDPATEAATAEATRAEPAPGDATQTEDTVTDHQDVGADAAASTEPDPEKEATVPEDPAGKGSDVGVAGGESDPQQEAATEDQAGAGADPAPANEPDADPTRREGE